MDDDILKFKDNNTLKLKQFLNLDNNQCKLYS